MLLAAPAYADDMADVSKLLKAGKVNEALVKTNEYLAKHPTDPQMRFMKGVILTEQNKSEEAIAVFTRLTEDYKDLPEPYNNLAVLYAANGQYEKARVTLERAIRTNPSYMTAYENLGDVYGKMASQAYDKALALGASSAPTKSKLTLLRTFSSSTAAKLVVPEAPPAPSPAPASLTAGAPANAARPAAPAPVALITPLPSPDQAKSQPLQRIPALSVSPPGGTPKAAPAPLPTPAPAPAPAIAAAKPAPVAAPVTAPAPVPAVTKPAPAPVPTPAPVVVAAKPAPAPAPLPVAKLEPAKAVPAPVPAAKQPEPVKPVKDNLESDAVLAQVHGWAKAWAAQNVDSYLGYYSKDFEPPKGVSRSAWAEERRTRIEGKGHIHVEVGNPEVTVSGNTARVTFHQTYVSDRLTARSRKTLVLVKNGGKWQIKQESSGS